MKKTLQSNILRNYIFTFSQNIALTEAIWMLYLAYKGLSLVEIGLLESIFHMTSLGMEIPTGIIADRFGRKVSRIAGRATAIAATLLMIQSNSFWGFCLAFILTAISYNLESGAGDALVYDTLVDLGTEDRYMTIKGRQEICFQSARISSLVLGGLVATFSYELAYLLTLGLQGFTLLQAFGFTEPQTGKLDQADQPRHLLAHIGESFTAIKENLHILPFMLYIELFSLFYTTTFFYLQTALKSTGLVESFIGMTLGLAAFVSMASSAKAHRLEQTLGPIRLIQLGSMALLACLGVMAFTNQYALGFIGMALVDGFLYVIFCDYINKRIPSTHRATLLSFQAMIFSSMMIVGFPIFGAISDHYGYSIAFKGMLLIAVPAMTLALLNLKKRLS